MRYKGEVKTLHQWTKYWGVDVERIRPCLVNYDPKAELTGKCFDLADRSILL